MFARRRPRGALRWRGIHPGLPETTGEGAARIAERIRSAVKQRTQVTISAGIGEFAGDRDFRRLVSRTDGALYEAKKTGRDRYVLATA